MSNVKALATSSSSEYLVNDARYFDYGDVSNVKGPNSDELDGARGESGPRLAPAPSSSSEYLVNDARYFDNEM